ncbi:MAG: hypothetical protein AAF942_15230, partial [Pseudomonadota bacterium]
TTVSELGSTFFTAIDKYRLAAKELARLDPTLKRSDPSWFGIDNSPFVNDVAQILHVKGEAPAILDDFRKVSRLDGYSLFMSRFVSSYVFRTTAEFADFLLANYDGGIVEDAFLAAGGEAEVFNHGQRETYLDLADLCRRLGAGGRRVFLLDHYPDFPAGTQPCFVCKLVILDRGTDPDVVAARCRTLGYAFDPATQEVDPDSVMAGLSAGTSSERWAQVQRYKAMEPVWGRTPEELAGESFKQTVMNRLYRLRQSVRVWQRGWRRLNIRHPLTFMDVQHALEDKRNE